MGNMKIKTAPCMINEGTLINKRDMIRALETLECVWYSDFFDNKLMSQGEGILLKVIACPESSTLIVNGSIFLNVFSFEYLRFYPDKHGNTTIELVASSRTLKLIPKEEDPKLISKISRNAYDYDDVCDGSDYCANLQDIDNEDENG